MEKHAFYPHNGVQQLEHPKLTALTNLPANFLPLGNTIYLFILL